MGYRDSEADRKEIDDILEENRRMQSDLGTDSTDEERYRVWRMWKMVMVPRIREIDAEFADTVE